MLSIIFIRLKFETLNEWKLIIIKIIQKSVRLF